MATFISNYDNIYYLSPGYQLKRILPGSDTFVNLDTTTYRYLNLKYVEVVNFGVGDYEGSSVYQIRYRVGNRLIDIFTTLDGMDELGIPEEGGKFVPR